jgi:hypothetical protein
MIMTERSTPPSNFASLPKERPSAWPSGNAANEGKEEGFSWNTLVPHFVHPVKVAIIEAHLWVQEPLSANELANLLGTEDHSLGVVAYHVKELAKVGALERVHERQAREARETFYCLASLE